MSGPFVFLDEDPLQDRLLCVGSTGEPPALLAPRFAVPVCSELGPPPRRGCPCGHASEIPKRQEARVICLPVRCCDSPRIYGRQSGIPGGLGGCEPVLVEVRPAELFLIFFFNFLLLFAGSL